MERALSPSPDPPPLHVVGAAILRHGRCLAAQRGSAMTDPDKWEFPGGKVEPGEAPTQALRREIAEELGLRIEVGRLLGRGEHRSGGRHIVLDVYCATLLDGEIRPVEHRDHRWLSAEDLPHLDWAAADRPVLPALAEILRHLDMPCP